MKKVFAILCLSILAGTVLFGQDLSLSDNTPFTSNIHGHHGTGKGSGTSRMEAERAAKAAALDRIFSELGKDTMFQEMYISMWPESIVVEESVWGETGKDEYTALVRVRIDQQAVIMTGQNYTDSVINLLDRTETVLEEVDTVVRKAQGYEENMRMSEAYTQYRQAETRLNELVLLISPVGDSSLQSSRGNTKPSLNQVLTTLLSTVGSGIERIEKIEDEVEVSEATEEIRKTFQLLEQQLVSIDAEVRQYGLQSPFYDMPRASLEAILTDLEQSDNLNREIAEKLEGLSAAVPEEKMFLIEKIELSSSETRRLDAVMERLIKEVKREIRVPRLVRQENARKRSEFLRGAGQVLVYHQPKDIFTLRYSLPVGVNLDTGSWGGGFGGTREFDLAASVEYYFADLVWFNTVLEKEDTLTGDAAKSIGLSQQVSLAFGRRFLIGAGGGWDWGRWVNDGTGTEPALREFHVNVIAGMIDPNHNWPWGTLTLNLPLRYFPVLYRGRLNGGMDLMLRISDLFQIAGGLNSVFEQIAAAADGPTVKDDPGSYLQYRLQWTASFGVRLPKPFMWGLEVEGGRTADIDGDGAVQDPDPYPVLFRLFIQYSI